ncbi:MAG: GDSL-type esterase/lipase family protein [Hyphomicrobiaceae bacterium]
MQQPDREAPLPTALAYLLALLAGLLFATVPSRAQAPDGASLLDPFPENDRYRVQVWGDQMADGLLEGLVEQAGDEPRLAIDKKIRWLSGLLKADLDQETKAIEVSLATGAPHIVVLMLGAGDRLAVRLNNRRFGVGSDEWKEEYARRADLVMRAFRKRNIGVFWLALPIMRRQDVNDDVEVMNEVFRSRALANGVRFIDIYGSFADADKSFNPYGPDLAGKMRLLRDSDGVHFTAAGYRKLAYFVERELKRAASQAWDERTIPLAGSEPEQARVRPPPTVKLAPLGAGTRPEAAAGGGGFRQSAGKSAQSVGDEGGIRAETSRITLRSLGEKGREESVTLEILRPAIPAQVVSLITRRESADKASQIGDPLMTEILGGLTVVSSVTPLAEASGERRRGGIDASTPLARVLQRGESLPPKPGRADEMPWPRPEPVLDPRLSQPMKPLPASTTAADLAGTRPLTRQPGPPAPVAPRASDEPPLPRRPSPSFVPGSR